MGPGEVLQAPVSRLLPPHPKAGGWGWCLGLGALAGPGWALSVGEAILLGARISARSVGGSALGTIRHFPVRLPVFGVRNTFLHAPSLCGVMIFLKDYQNLPVVVARY